MNIGNIHFLGQKEMAGKTAAAIYPQKLKKSILTMNVSWQRKQTRESASLSKNGKGRS
jgi:hypothetical protein